jgi:hypothetical protein
MGTDDNCLTGYPVNAVYRPDTEAIQTGHNLPIVYQGAEGFYTAFLTRGFFQNTQSPPDPETEAKISRSLYFHASSP